MTELDPIQLTRKLVDIDSTTFHEGAAGEFLFDFLGGRQFQVERMPVGQSSDGGPRFNVYAGDGGVPDVVFSTHMDTVPPFFPSSEDDLFVYGRGSCDAKGIIAAQVAAAERLRDAKVRVGLLFVVGEERDSAGARVANKFSKGSRYIINGEPTDNRLALASKGALRVELRAHGKMGHSAYPELGESATEKLVVALGRILDLKLPVVDGVGASTLNIGVIHGGHAPNVIADAAEAHLLIRLVGPAAEIRRSVENAVEGLVDVGFPLELPYLRLTRPAGLGDDVETMIAAFTTDLPSLTQWGEPLLLGPGSIHVAHTPDEKLAKKELSEAVDLYTRVALALLS